MKMLSVCGQWFLPRDKQAAYTWIKGHWHQNMVTEGLQIQTLRDN
jgi:hypothetical protein